MTTDCDGDYNRFEVPIRQMAAKAETLSYLLLASIDGDGEFGNDEEDIRGVSAFLEDMGRELKTIHETLWGNGKDGQDPETQEKEPRGE